MPTLSDDIKTFIVMALAQYDAPSEVVEAVRANFDLEITRQQVHAYDPACAKPPAPRWCALHAAAREAFLRQTAEIGIAHRSVRLKMLDRMTRRALAHNFTDRAAGYLEQAAKECGGFYDRRTPSVSALVPTSAEGAEESDRLDRRLPPPREQSQPGERADEERQSGGEGSAARSVHDHVVEAVPGATEAGPARARADPNAEGEKRDACPTVPAGEVRMPRIAVPTGERQRNLLSSVAAVIAPTELVVGVAPGRPSPDVVADSKSCRSVGIAPVDFPT